MSWPFPMNTPCLPRHAKVAAPLASLAFLLVWPQAATAQAAADAVVVTGSRIAEDLSQLPQAASVLTATDLQRAGVATVNEALMKLLGVPGRLDLYGGGEYTLDLRGFGATADSNQVVVVDGMRISEADGGGTRLAGMSIDSIERIELLRGNGAVLYGEGASAGVIVITTRSGQGAARRNAADLYLAAGSLASRELRGGATLAGGEFSIDVAANRRSTDGHRANFASVAEGGSVAAQWGNDWLRLVARHAADKLDTGLPGALTAEQYAADPHQTTRPDDHADIHNRRSALQLAAKWSGWSLALDGGWRDKRLRSLNGKFAYDYDVDASQWSVRGIRSVATGAVTHTLTVGADFNRWQRQVLGDFGSHAEQRNRGLYMKDEAALGGGTRLTAGLRRDAVSKAIDTGAAGIDRSLYAWELGMVQPLAAGWQGWGRIGRSFRLANADEFSFTAPGAVLQPQTSRDVELGLRWRGAVANAELFAWRSALRDEIGYDPAAGPFGANVNFDRTLRQGVEFQGRQSLGASLSLRATAAWRQARFSAGAHDGKTVPLVPGRNGSLGAVWQPVPGHSLGATVLYAGDRYPDIDNACRIPSVATIDLRYAVSVAMAELALNVANATDRRSYTQAFACVDGQPSAIYPEPGRVVMASLRLRF